MSNKQESIITGIDVSESVLTATNNDVYYSQKAVDELQNVIKRLQEENEKLKADLKGETEQAQKWYQLETDKHFQMMKYEQVLEEIRNIAETPIIADKNRFDEITNKINEVLNDV